MPIYEYACESCGHRFDELQKISDPPLTVCPECGRPDLKKLLSAPNFRLKGGGWYETDFKSQNQRNLAGDKSDKAKKDDKAKDDKTGKSGDKKPASGDTGSAAAKD